MFNHKNHKIFAPPKITRYTVITITLTMFPWIWIRFFLSSVLCCFLTLADHLYPSILVVFLPQLIVRRRRHHLHPSPSFVEGRICMTTTLIWTKRDTTVSQYICLCVNSVSCFDLGQAIVCTGAYTNCYQPLKHC